MIYGQQYNYTTTSAPSNCSAPGASEPMMRPCRFGDMDMSLCPSEQVRAISLPRIYRCVLQIRCPAIRSHTHPLPTSQPSLTLPRSSCRAPRSRIVPPSYFPSIHRPSIARVLNISLTWRCVLYFESDSPTSLQTHCWPTTGCRCASQYTPL